jgi:hypothetical protein
MPRLCEQCGNYDPTPVLTADSRCPCCGMVYARIRPPSVPAQPMAAAARSFETHEADFDWQPLKPAEVWLSIAAVLVLFAIIVFDDDGFVLILDHANLAFHEAGHLFFGMLGRTLGLYGGTLGQLVFPIVAGVGFWRRRQAVGMALSGVWLFENFLNIARYMADARAQLLPLVGGGEHDWYHIFSGLGLLNHDTAIAAITQALGWLGMVGCTVWLWRRSNRASAYIQERAVDSTRKAQ